MIIIIPIILVLISEVMLYFIKMGRIVKYARFLKIVNIVHLIAVCLLLVFLFLILPLFGGRDEALMAFFIYFLFGAAALIGNIVVLLKNICRKS